VKKSEIPLVLARGKKCFEIFVHFQPFPNEGGVGRKQVGPDDSKFFHISVEQLVLVE
jgi:hypothetical protein